MPKKQNSFFIPMLPYGYRPVDPRLDLPDRREHMPGLGSSTPLHLRTDLIPAGGIDVLAAAKIHEQSRLQAVAEMLSLLAMMAGTGVIAEEMTVTVSRALLQRGKGSKKQNTQAAHCIPGHVLIDGLPLHHYLEAPPGLDSEGLHYRREEFLRRRKFNPQALCDKVREIFERTEVVMTQLNQTDSLVENEHMEAGLKEVFELAAGCAVSSPQHGNLYKASWLKVREAAEFAFNFYRERAAVKVSQAEQEKMADRNRLHSSQVVEREKVETTIMMLRCFETVLHTAPVPDPVTVTGFGPFRAKVMIGA